MDGTGHPGFVTATELSTPVNLEILAQTAASQSIDDHNTYTGYPVLKINENAGIPVPLLPQHIRIEGQPGGPMLSQSQLHKILNSVDPDKSPGPLSIITTTSVNDHGQTSPASLSNASHILQYRSAGTTGDAMLSAINYSENEILQESAFDVGSNLGGNIDDSLLSGIGNPSRMGENPTSETFGLFDGDGDSLNMETLSPPGLLIADTGSLHSVSESGDSISDSLQQGDDRKKAKAKAKNGGKGPQVSPGKGGPVECNQCHKSFNNTSALAKHKLTHSDERKFLCTICDKKFKRQDHLNGHLMTHRDKKPYQCVVANCEKSYCDARSLKRHLENHHQHSSDQIAAEMQTAASQAADILAEVTSAPQTVVTNKSPLNSQSLGLLQPAHSESVIQNTSVVSGPSEVQMAQVAVTAVQSEDNVLARQLLSLKPTAGALVTLALAGGQLQGNPGSDVSSHQQHTATVAQYEALLNMEQQQRPTQIQFLQDQASNQDALKMKQEHIEALQQQIDLQQQHTVASRASPTPSWQTHHSSNIQSPVSSEMSPGYSELSPISHDRQLGPPGSPGRSQNQVWIGQASQLIVAPNTTVADLKPGDENSKPVVCSICQRRFKNVPALNGHMRLHGGYFKKENALKEERKKKADMAPPAGLPARTGPSVGSPPSAATKKTKGTPPLQSPPSEELHHQHWQQKQEQQLKHQLKQQLQHLQFQDTHQQQAKFQQPQVQVQQQAPVHTAPSQQQVASTSQTVQEHLKQIQQKMEQQQQLQQQQQQLQQQIQAQVQLEQQQHQQSTAEVQLAAPVLAQISDNPEAHLSQMELIQLAQLQESGLDSQQIEQLKLQLAQQNLQQQLQQQQEAQQQQMIFDNPNHVQPQQLGGGEMQQFNPGQVMPQSPHLPTSPQYMHPHSVPQSPQVPQSPLLQRQGSVEPLQSPVPEYNTQTIPGLQDMSGMSNRFGNHVPPEYANLPHNIQQQLQLQSQNIHVNNLQQQQSGNINLQNAHLGRLHGASMPISSGIDLNNQLQQQQMTYNQSVNIQHDQSSFQPQISGQFHVAENIVPSEVSGVPVAGGNHTASEIVSQIITSLESLGEVAPGTMQEIKSETGGLPQLTDGVFTSDNTRQFQQQPISTSENGMNNSLNEFAHNSVLLNQGVSSSFNSPFISQQPQVTESRGSVVKQELIKHLASKPSSPRAAQASQFPFQNNNNNSGMRQRHHSAKADINPSSVVSKTQEINSELKRRLSAGPEDIRSPLLSHASAPDIISRTYVKPSCSRSDDTKPRLRSKSGDDFRLRRWGNEDHFMKPKIRSEDFAHRPRSKTDEHLSKWRNREVFSKSDGAGVFRNPSSMAPGSLKMRRKHRPAPLIIPSHANMCGFQSRLRSPRIYLDADAGSKTAPVPYTPPPMLSPLRRGSGLFSSLQHSASSTPQPLVTAGQIQTPRPSLLRSASIQKVDKQEESSDETVPFVEEQPPPPESDILPHVNIGPQYQAALPEFNPHKKMAMYDVSKEDLLFDPACLQSVAEDEVQSYQDLCCCSAVSANGFNVEYGLHLLYISGGDIQCAMLMLMSGSCKLAKNHSLSSYSYQESDVWLPDEIDNYTQAILKVDKDFFRVANMVKTKSVRQCVQFYYLWKKVLVDEHKRLRALRRRREQDYNLRSTRNNQPTVPPEVVADVAVKVGAGADVTEEPDGRDMSAEDEDSLSEASTSVGTFDDHNEKDLDTDDQMDISAPVENPVIIHSPVPSFSCEFNECHSSFSSKGALNAHMKIHQKVTKPPVSSTTVSHGYENKHTTASRSPVHQVEPQPDMFPCKLCGRVFAKVKSRSAHMKIHRPDQDKEKEKKAKLAKQQAAAAASLDPLYTNYRYTNLPNGPSQL